MWEAYGKDVEVGNSLIWEIQPDEMEHVNIYHNGMVCATVTYDRDKDQLKTVITEDLEISAPVFLRLHRNEGTLELDDQKTREWLSYYVPPQDHAYIKNILKSTGLKKYNLYDLFCAFNMKCGLVGGFVVVPFQVPVKPRVETP